MKTYGDLIVPELERHDLISLEEGQEIRHYLEEEVVEDA